MAESLHELYEQYDEIWAEMLEDNERYHRERREKGITGPIVLDEQAQEIRDRLSAVRDKINEHGEQDFETAFREALFSRLADRDFAEDAYRCLCNVEWRHEDGSRYSCSWRYAGGLIAELRDHNEDYMDFYCSGQEGSVREDIAELMAARGWTPFEEEN